MRGLEVGDKARDNIQTICVNPGEDSGFDNECLRN